LQIGVHDADRDYMPKKSFPNLALMKISAYHKCQGDTVEWWSKNGKYDVVYSSKVFDFTPENPELPKGTIKGGTGYGLYEELPPEIEACKPDYSIYPDCDYAIGFITRGCPKKCKHCTVPQKEGDIRPYARWNEIVRSDSNTLKLMDSNILACEHGIQQLAELAKTDYKIDINQGMDAEYFTERIADTCAKIKWHEYIRFSCDSIKKVEAISNAIKLLTERGIKEYKVFVYFLVTNDIQEAAERLDLLKQHKKITIYAQAERNPSKGITPSRAQLEFAQRYVYGGAYRKETWSIYNQRRGLPHVSLEHGLKVVSLFDGISCGRLALERAGIDIQSYIAYEIDKHAISISRYHFPSTVQKGDVFEANFDEYSGYDLLIGGSPCTFWSSAKSDGNRENDKDGMGWKLFIKYIDALRTIKPKYFLYENVESMPKNIREYISEELGCEPIMLNSSFVSAQNCKRLYWTNIKCIGQPENKGILLQDILESGLAYQEKCGCITATYNGAIFWNSIEKKQRTMVAEPIKNLSKALKKLRENNNESTYGIYHIKNKFIAEVDKYGISGKVGTVKIDLPDGYYHARKFSPEEAEVLQTLPKGYTAVGLDGRKRVNISNANRFKPIGNGWTIDILAHIFKSIVIFT